MFKRTVRPTRRLARRLALPPLLALLALPAWAQSSATFTVTATVLPACTVIGGGALAFGIVTPGNQSDGSVNVTAICTVGTPYTLSLSAGTGTGATMTQRRMTSGADTLVYGLYRDAGRTQPWGDGTGGSSTVASTGTGLSQSFTVYGRVPSSATATVGVYLDTITVTATY
ncbi:MAG: spore coat U domain-containing protein [Hydrogenophaga sp.]|uniref:Spore coat U domain-containing protein n=1 Tax=Hydrogenophaga crocea TaxID=2716225 RepID=A0A6G8IER1_9BURK|nr:MULTISPECIES: spore coat U domain-containing protein [Hydrogenophaga]MBL0943393.1 spore coat U domain-containing protein [Hydrogenophaga sp.]QIM51480.1 spore coat U domain-containing protein [Hydrogenophaga crocea]